jgi:hypothetical protein
MNYRMLDAEEWPRLALLFDEMGFPLPPPEVATAVVAEDDNGELQAAIMFQLQLHLEPLLIKSPAVNFKRLFHTFEEAFAERHGLVYYAFITNPHVARIASIVGMVRTPQEVWQGRID